jgi:hypothetical protein
MRVHPLIAPGILVIWVVSHPSTIPGPTWLDFGDQMGTLYGQPGRRPFSKFVFSQGHAGEFFAPAGLDRSLCCRKGTFCFETFPRNSWENLTTHLQTDQFLRRLRLINVAVYERFILRFKLLCINIILKQATKKQNAPPPPLFYTFHLQQRGGGRRITKE